MARKFRAAKDDKKPKPEPTGDDLRRARLIQGRMDVATFLAQVGEYQDLPELAGVIAEAERTLGAIDAALADGREPK